MVILDNEQFLNESAVRVFLGYMGIPFKSIRGMGRTAVQQRLGINSYFEVTTAIGELLAIDKYYVYALTKPEELNQSLVNKEFSRIWRKFTYRNLQQHDIEMGDRDYSFSKQYFDGFQTTKEHTLRNVQDKIAAMQTELDDMMKETF